MKWTIKISSAQSIHVGKPIIKEGTIIKNRIIWKE